MADYLPASASVSFDIVAPDVETRLTIFARLEPPTRPGETFTISGNLSRQDTLRAISGATIPVSYNGVNVGTAVTDSNGQYSINTSIPATGTYTLRATFAGMPIPGAILAASKASFQQTIGVLAEPMLILASLVTGLVLTGVSYLLPTR